MPKDYLNDFVTYAAVEEYYDDLFVYEAADDEELYADFNSADFDDGIQCDFD